MDVIGRFKLQPLYPLGNSFLFTLNRRLVVYLNFAARFGEEKNLLLLMVFGPQFADPAA
jgi:hypothetical protein